MRYALLAYGNTDLRDGRSDEEGERVESRVAQVLERPEVTGWLRLRDTTTATTVRRADGGSFLTDGPFVESKDFIGGFILVEAEDLDGALAVAAELQEIGGTAAIEVRPVREEPLGGA